MANSIYERLTKRVKRSFRVTFGLICINLFLTFMQLDFKSFVFDFSFQHYFAVILLIVGIVSLLKSL